MYLPSGKRNVKKFMLRRGNRGDEMEKETSCNDIILSLVNKISRVYCAKSLFISTQAQHARLCPQFQMAELWVHLQYLEQLYSYSAILDTCYHQHQPISEHVKQADVGLGLNHRALVS